MGFLCNYYSAEWNNHIRLPIQESDSKLPLTNQIDEDLQEDPTSCEMRP
jgi:hypothetical protein